MGAQASQERPDLILFKKLITERPDQPDASFWTSIWTLAPPRADNFLPDPAVLSDIAQKSPQDFVTLVLLCVKHVKMLKDADSSQLMPDVLLDQLSWGLALFTSACEVLLSNTKLFELLQQVDAGLADQLEAATPEVKRATEIARRKRAEAGKSKKQEEEKRNEVQGEEAKPEAAKKAAPKEKKAKEEPKRVPKSPIDGQRPASKKAANAEQKPAVAKNEGAQKRPVTPKNEGEAQQKQEAVKKKAAKKEGAQQRPATPKGEAAGQQKQAVAKKEGTQQRPATPKGEATAPQKQAPQQKQAGAQKRPATPKTEAAPQQKQAAVKKEGRQQRPNSPKKEDQQKAAAANQAQRPASPKKNAGKAGQQKQNQEAKKAMVKQEIQQQNQEVKPVKKAGKKKAAQRQREEGAESKDIAKAGMAEGEQEPKPKREQQQQAEQPQEPQTTNDTAHAVPRSKTPSETEAELIHAMKVNQGKCVQVLIETLCQSLFKLGLTLEGKETYWTENPSEPASLNQTRRDLVHALLGILSLNYFVKGDGARPHFVFEMTEFPPALFLHSTCGIATQHLQQLSTGVKDSVLTDLLRNCFALTTRLFVTESFRAAFKDVKASVFLKAFALGPKAVPLFEPFSSLSCEALSFLYMSLLCQPKLVTLISKGKYSNTFIYNLAYTAQLTFERADFCYIHSIVLSITLLLVTKPQICQNLSDEYTEKFNCQYRPDKGSYADLLMNVLLNICEKESFWPSLVCIFHMLAPHVRTFSNKTAQRVMALFDAVSEKQKPLVPLFIESFAAIVQKRDNANNHFLVYLLLRASVLRKMTPDCPRLEQALPIIQKYLKSAIKTAKATKKSQVSGDELVKILEAADVDKIFGGETVKFTKHPHVFGGEMEKTWAEWADLLFAKSFSPEVELAKHLTE